MGQKKILIVEDEVVIRSSLRRFLENESFQVCEANNLNEALAFDLQTFSVIITDLRLPGPQGTDIIRLARDVPVLVMTSYASLRSAVETMKMGAADYIAKPFDYEELLTTIKDLIAQREGSRPATQPPIENMLGGCKAMRELFDRIAKVAPTDTNVLIVGESGTGKELAAKAIHNSSHRADRDMISLNCAAIPDSLIESELFGHEKGAFTGATSARVGLIEAADGGTLFLDEIGELPLDAQARLLRVLQEGEVRRVGSVATRNVSVRLIVATHRDLRDLTRRGEFREDLYYRLNVVKISLPPLRERDNDLVELANHFLKANCYKLGKQTLEFSNEALDLITQYRWPGNIRELENAIERAVILCEASTIEPELLAIDLDFASDTGECRQEENLSLEDYFQKFVLENQDHMTETELAQSLGISRKSLWERRQKLKIPREQSKR